MILTEKCDSTGRGAVRALLLVMVFAGVLPAGAGTAGAQGVNNIDSCTTIDASNAPSDGLVNLTSNIMDAPQSPCINVTVSDITLDGQGNRLDGDANEGIGISVTNDIVSLSNVEIRNFTMTDWDGLSGRKAGVKFRDTTDSLVTEIDSSNNRNGVFTTSSTARINVTDSQFDGDSLAVHLDGSNHNVKNVTATNSGTGISSRCCDPITIRDSVSTDNGIALSLSGGDTVVNTTAFGSSNKNVDVSNSPATVEDLDIGDSTGSDTTVDFAADWVELNTVSSPPADPPQEQNISRYIDAISTLSGSARLNITFEYTDSDVSDVEEATLDVWKNNGTWTEFGGTVDTAENEVSYNITNFGSVFAPLAGDDALFTESLIGSFDGPPTNTQELDNTLYEDLSGDGDGKDTTQTVRVFGALIRGNDLGLTDEQARALNWNPDSPETEVTPADMVSLFGKQIRA